MCECVFTELKDEAPGLYPAWCNKNTELQTKTVQCFQQKHIKDYLSRQTASPPLYLATGRRWADGKMPCTA